MRFDKFTIKSQELIQGAQALASQLGHQQIEPEHLLKVMLEPREGIARSVLQKLGASPEGVLQDVSQALEKKPMLSGAGAGEAYLSATTKKVLDGAFTEAAKMKDEYVSIEHILVAMTDQKNTDAARILAAAGVIRGADANAPCGGGVWALAGVETGRSTPSAMHRLPPANRSRVRIGAVALAGLCP